MKKVIRALAGLSAAALIFGISACATGGDSGIKYIPMPSGGSAAPYAGPESVETPDLSVAPATEGEIKINDAVYDGTFAQAIASLSATGDYVITLAPGTYVSNNVHYTGNANIKIKGLGTAKYGADVILAGKGDNTANSAEKTRSTFEYEGSGTLILENITIKNTLIRSESPSKNTQCEALGFDGAYCAAYNCGFFAYQDTVRTIGKSWFYGCYIEGDVDFMWMEKSGKVALYENCAIKTVYDTSDGKSPSAYILAPGMTAADNFNKGLVVWNSAVYTSVASDFFRNPWGVQENLYNIGAFVNIKLSGKENLTANLQKSTASNYDLNDAIGWKIDKGLADEIKNRSSEIHVISPALEKAEYNGRNRIINRIYKLNPGKYANDADAWDVNKLASDNGWTVTEDKSKLDEVKGDLKANGVYKIAEYATDTSGQGKPIADGSSTDGYVSWTGILWHSTGYGTQTSANATISIDVSGSSIVSFIGSQHSNGTVKVTDAAGKVVLDTYSTKLATDKTPMSIAYAGPATTLTFTFTGTTYIGDLTVSPSDGEKQAIKKVVVSGDDAVTVEDSITLKATVTTQYCAPTTVKWSSSAPSIAAVDENGVVTGVAAGEAIITATSTYDKTKKASLKVTVTAVKSSKAIWLDSSRVDTTTNTTSLEGRATDETLITVASATHTDAGTWGYNPTKLAGEGIVLTDSDAEPQKGEWYVEYPITAVTDIKITKAKINWGETGASDLFAYVTYQEEGKAAVVISDTGDSVRSSKNESATYLIDKELAKGKTATIRISIHGDKTAKEGGSGYQTLSGKCAVWGKTEITCQLNEPEPPVAGETYTWDFLGENTAKYEANADGTAHTDGFLTYKQTSWNGGGHAFNTKTNDTLTVTVIGSVTITVSQTYNGAGWTVTTTGGTLSSVDLAGQNGNADYTVTLTAAADAVNTVTFTSKGQNYASKVVVAPASN